jgi:DNA-binding winged helix-turn-helix (wHTH) protein
MIPLHGAVRLGRFVFDPTSGELRDAGATEAATRLQPQVAALLCVFLEHPGSVVTRAELQARLWPDTTVDFDEGLNYCVRQLRLALGDDASAPRFIETLPRRGYRLIAPVGREVGSSAPPPPARRSPALLVGIAAVVIIAGAVVATRVAFTRDATRAPAAALAIGPFAADTTDSTLVTYRGRLVDQLHAGLRATLDRRLVPDTTSATHVLSGRLTRRGFSVEVMVGLVRRPGHRFVWVDSILDSYAFSGNSTLTADRIARSVTRLLQPDSAAAGPP